MATFVGGGVVVAMVHDRRRWGEKMKEDVKNGEGRKWRRKRQKVGGEAGVGQRRQNMRWENGNMER